MLISSFRSLVLRQPMAAEIWLTLCSKNSRNAYCSTEFFRKVFVTWLFLALNKIFLVWFGFVCWKAGPIPTIPCTVCLCRGVLSEMSSVWRLTSRWHHLQRLRTVSVFCQWHVLDFFFFKWLLLLYQTTYTTLNPTLNIQFTNMWL